MRASPVTPIDIEEALWLNGLTWDNLEPLDRGYLPGDVPELPLEQHSCCHGSQFVRRHKGALRCCGWAIVVWSLLVFWAALFAALGVVARWLR